MERWVGCEHCAAFSSGMNADDGGTEATAMAIIVAIAPPAMTGVDMLAMAGDDELRRIPPTTGEWSEPIVDAGDRWCIERVLYYYGFHK